ncbi:Transcriptional regulator xre family [Levilactobacillus brevis]|uniref:Transcriptional regulator xre family n=2 Tax=Levilactobacillus brevis TaxID=1580 RepID=A0A5B7Y2J8_LEVBR|nr:Transcriptional regulator, XRE family [Levilactobacillus brevis]QCZ54182.1 Transcriptional regulator xre family [Levilactobacillus brevis]
MENKFNTQLSQLRRQAGLSQEQLASQVFVTRQSVSKWEQGETTPDLDTLISLATVLGVSLDELVSGRSTAIHQTETEATFDQPEPAGAKEWGILASGGFKSLD